MTRRRKPGMYARELGPDMLKAALQSGWTAGGWRTLDELTDYMMLNHYSNREGVRRTVVRSRVYRVMSLEISDKAGDVETKRVGRVRLYRYVSPEEYQRQVEETAALQQNREISSEHLMPFANSEAWTYDGLTITLPVALLVEVLQQTPATTLTAAAPSRIREATEPQPPTRPETPK